jgi:hypothetical protein
MTPPSSDASRRSLDRAHAASIVSAPDPYRLDSESRTTVDFRFRFCTCGCGNHTSGHFIPGHNQRLRGALTRSYQRAQLVRVLQPLTEPVLAAAPAVAGVLGPEWLAWIAPDVEVDQAVRLASAAALNAAADEFERECL